MRLASIRLVNPDQLQLNEVTKKEAGDVNPPVPPKIAVNQVMLDEEEEDIKLNLSSTSSDILHKFGINKES